MGDSIRLQIADAAKTSLEAASVTVNGTPRTKPTGLTVHRFRLRPLQSEGLPAQVISFHEDPNPDPRLTGLLDRTLRLAVEHKVKVTAGTPPDDQVDPLVSWATFCLMDDETLGGLSNRIDERGTAWVPDEAEHQFMKAITLYDISYQTRRNDPEAQT